MKSTIQTQFKCSVCTLRPLNGNFILVLSSAYGIIVKSLRGSMQNIIGYIISWL